MTSELTSLSATVTYHSLTLDGLHIIYTFLGKSVSARFDPRSTIDMMHRLGMIEGYDTHKETGEPVILFEKEVDDGNGNWATKTGYSTWEDFVKTYPLQAYEAAIVAELNEGDKAMDFFQETLRAVA